MKENEYERHTPSQAEGERDEDQNERTAAWHHGPDSPWTTPSQAEGERNEEEEGRSGSRG